MPRRAGSTACAQSSFSSPTAFRIKKEGSERRAIKPPAASVWLATCLSRSSRSQRTGAPMRPIQILHQKHLIPTFNFPIPWHGCTYLPSRRELRVAPGVPRIIHPKFCAPTFIPFLVFLAASVSMSLRNRNGCSSALRWMFLSISPLRPPNISSGYFCLSLSEVRVGTRHAKKG